MNAQEQELTSYGLDKEWGHVQGHYEHSGLFEFDWSSSCGRERERGIVILLLIKEVEFVNYLSLVERGSEDVETGFLTWRLGSRRWGGQQENGKFVILFRVALDVSDRTDLLLSNWRRNLSMMMWYGMSYLREWSRTNTKGHHEVFVALAVGSSRSKSTFSTLEVSSATDIHI